MTKTSHRFVERNEDVPRNNAKARIGLDSEEVIRALMKEHEYTVTDVAIRLKCSIRVLNRMIKEPKYFRLEDLYLLCGMFGMTVPNLVWCLERGKKYDPEERERKIVRAKDQKRYYERIEEKKRGYSFDD